MRHLCVALALAAALLMYAPLQTLAAGNDLVSTNFATFPWGQCTWYVASRRPDVGRWVAGNAWWWINAATAVNWPNGPDPRVGAVATFQPGIQYASWVFGHVGYVEQVAANGTDFLISEMNATCGLGCVDHRWVHAGSGVRFLY